MAFDYVVALRLAGRRAVVVGDGPIARQRAEDLAASGADVDLQLHGFRPGSLTGAAVAIATGEGDLDVDTFWTESRDEGVLASVLDDLAHTDFAAPALVRRGDLRIAISTAGRAPALAKRLRQHLEEEYGPELGVLVEAVEAARARLGPRNTGFDEWAAAWAHALEDLDGLLNLVRTGRSDDAVDRIAESVREGVGQHDAD